MDCSMAGFSVLLYPLQFVETHVHWVDDAIQPSHPLLSPPPALIFPSIRVFSRSQKRVFCISTCIGYLHQVAKVLELQLQHRSLRWTFRVFPYYPLVWSSCCLRDSQESSPAPQLKKHQFFWCSALFLIQLSHLCMTIGKTIALTIQTFVGKGTSAFNAVSRFVIAFLPVSRHLLISWLPLPSAVFLEPKKRESVTASTFYLLFAMKWWNWMPWS